MGDVDGRQRLLAGGKVNRFIPNPTFDLVSESGALKDMIGADRILMGSDGPHAEGLADPTAYIEDLERFDCIDVECRFAMSENGLALAQQ